ncbi:Uncharacterised protein [Klebsiella pneumoniae]|nr:Uncharacterised protein [Klebsiella pneumoniae]
MSCPIISRIDTRAIFSNRVIHFVLFFIVYEFFIFKIKRLVIIFKI